MINSIKNFLNSFVAREVNNAITFQIIGDVLIVYVPRSKSTQTKNEEYCKKVLEQLTPYRQEFGVKSLIVTNKGE